MPTADQAVELARALLGPVGTRLPHVLAAAGVAAEVGPLIVPADVDLLVAAATLHDIGYAPAIARTGFHPLDGANHLMELGFSVRLGSLVAHHSHAIVTAPDHGIHNLGALFPQENSLLCDVLCYSDMHASPTGQRVSVDERLADIRARHVAPRTAARLRMVRESVERVRRLLAEAGQSTASLKLADQSPANDAVA